MKGPLISIWILILPAFLATLLLYVRLTKVLSPRFVFFLLIYGFFFFWLKEFLQARGLFLNHVYTFSNQMDLRLGSVPIVIIVGHLFTFGLSLSIGLRLLRRLLVPANAPFVLSICFAVSMAVAYMVEPGGAIAGWWHWGYGDLPWWEVEELQWMGEVHLGIVSFERNSIGDVPACLLAGWPVGISLFLIPVLVQRTFFEERFSILQYVGYLLVIPVMLLAEVFKPVVPVVIIGILLLGFRKDGNRAILPMEKTKDRHRTGALDRLTKNGDYLAFFMFLLVIAFVEFKKGVVPTYMPSWIPLTLYVLLTLVQRRKTILLIVLLICLVSVLGHFSSLPARWLTPFQVIYFVTIGFMVPSYLIFQRYRLRQPVR